MNGGMKAHKTRAQIEAEIREHARQMEANAREREQKDMAYLLRKKGYSPHHAAGPKARASRARAPKRSWLDKALGWLR